jgi:tetratricopeptide (TPR) repeat protein
MKLLHVWTARCAIYLLLPLGPVPATSFAISHTSADSNPPNRVLVGLWDRNWGVTLDLPGFTVKENDIKPDGRRYLLAADPTINLEVSVFIEDASQNRIQRSCREGMEERLRDNAQNMALQIVGGIEKKDTKIWEAGGKTFLDYTIPSMTAPDGKKQALNQKNRFACFERDNAFIDLHLSKVNSQPNDEGKFNEVIDSVGFREGIVRGSTDYLQVGSLFYLGHDYQRAIAPYAQALALEQKNRQLDKKLWFVLVDNLGMAYGITGNLDKARETFEYGIQQDPDYPLFYYNMAGYFGEKEDASNAALYLKKA